MSLHELTAVVKPSGQDSLAAENTGIGSGQLGPPCPPRPECTSQGSGDRTCCEGSRDGGVCITGPGLRADPPKRLT